MLVTVETSLRSDPAPPPQSGWRFCAFGRERNPHPLLSDFFFTGRQHDLISFFCCTILEKRDNGRLEIHVSDSHQTSTPSFYFLSSRPSPPLVCPTPASLSPHKISIKPPSAPERGRGVGGGLAVLNQTTSSVLPHIPPLPPLPPYSPGCNSLSRVLYLMTCESN